MSDTPAKFSDPNPVFQSVIETAREVYRKLLPGASGVVTCSYSLLIRQDPPGQEFLPENRLYDWASQHGMEVAKHQRTVERGLIQPPVELVIKITRPTA